MDLWFICSKFIMNIIIFVTLVHMHLHSQISIEQLCVGKVVPVLNYLSTTP
jgi:hypothetical protein